MVMLVVTMADRVPCRWGRLSMTRETLRERNRIVLDFCYEHQLPVVTTMGGGYSKPIQRSAEAHVDVFEQAAEHFERGRRA
jgi:acetoin utilization deacetylase AcuC-like enzyme